MSKKLFKNVILSTFLLLGGLAGESQASAYVSFKGGFYFEYPDDWNQINYLTADAFLSRNASDYSVLGYEAVFAPKVSSPFFANDYLILTVDTMDWLYEYREDSIVAEMKESFGEDFEYFPSWDMPGNIKSTVPIYDKEKRILSVVNNVVDGDKIIKRNLLIKKFHDKGVANFYFFSPDSMFEQSQAIFRAIVNSFGTENINEKLPKENVTVASKIEPDKPIDMKSVLIVVGLAAAVLAAILFRMRSSGKRKQENS